jgi:hypothetical protein
MPDFTLNAPDTMNNPWEPGPPGLITPCGKLQQSVTDFFGSTAPAGYSIPATATPFTGYPACPGSTAYGLALDGSLAVFHMAHEPTHPCRWLTAPRQFKEVNTGDRLNWEIETSKTRVRFFLNGVEVTPVPNGWAGIPA